MKHQHTGIKYTYRFIQPFLLLTFLVSPTAQAGEPVATSNQTLLGGALFKVPRYEGSELTTSKLLPLISIRRGRWSAGVVEGVSLNLSESEGMSYGPVLSYSFGRKERDSQSLQGLGDIDESLDGGFFVNMKLASWSLGVKAGSALVGASNGSRVQLSADYGLSLSPSQIVSLGLSSSWIDDRYASRYFSVDSMQSIGSGLPEYSADSGFKDIAATLRWTYFYNRHWLGIFSVSRSRLLGDVADSPLVSSRNQQKLGIIVGYNF